MFEYHIFPAYFYNIILMLLLLYFFYYWFYYYYIIGNTYFPAIFLTPHHCCFLPISLTFLPTFHSFFKTVKKWRGKKEKLLSHFFLLDRRSKADEILKCYKVTRAMDLLFICPVRHFFPQTQGILEKMESRKREKFKKGSKKFLPQPSLWSDGHL